MKLQPVGIAATLFLFSSTASAGWFDGNNFTDSNAQFYGDSSRSTTGKGNAAGNSTGKLNGWNSNTGDADAEVDFSMNFKGKGRTAMDTQLTADSQAEAKGNGVADYAGAGNGSWNTFAKGSLESDSNAVGTFPPSAGTPDFFPTSTMIPASAAPTVSQEILHSQNLITFNQ